MITSFGATKKSYGLFLGAPLRDYLIWKVETEGFKSDKVFHLQILSCAFSNFRVKKNVLFI